MNFSHLNFGNNFVSMHQFSTATKVVGNVQQNIAFIPASSSQHYHHSNQVSFPNNGQITTAVIQHQHHYQDTSSRILSQNSSSHSVNINTPTSTTAQTSWIDGVSSLPPGDNALKINLPSFPPQTQGAVSHISQPIQGSFRTVLMRDASTMTECETTEVRNGIIKDTVMSEDSDDSSKSDSNSLKKSGCSNSCSTISLKNTRPPLAEYLQRLKPIQMPQNIVDFLKDNHIDTIPKCFLPKGNDEALGRSNNNIESKEVLYPGKPEIRLSNAPDGSLLFCCAECNIGYPDKDQLERHLTVHKADRRFECNVCGVFLKRKEHLDQHKRGHSEERPFVCEICCKGFKRNEHLRRHIVIHSGDKNHVCTECGKAFSRKDHLNKHHQTHISKRSKSEPVEPTSPLLHYTQKPVHSYTPK